ncbi:MAG: aspartate kinase, partial [Muribaculaceae bacterium]|nr:aspartate kinase [Muribaculaceae bacterium]
MKVMKFGGTSVGSAQRMKNMVALVAAEGNVMVVLSAMSGTTNSLISISQSIMDAEPGNARKQIDDLEIKYKDTAADLLSDETLLNMALTYVNEVFSTLRTYIDKPFSSKEEKEVVAFGEKLSTNLVALYMK